MGDNLFHSVATEHLFRNAQSQESTTEVIGPIIKIFVDNLKVLQERIQNNLIECHYLMMKVSLDQEDEKSIEFIKDLNPFQIDWSNIPDYFSNKDFVKMAKLCSSHDTTHTAHFMNWNQKVFGTHIYDYKDSKQKVFNEIVDKSEKIWCEKLKDYIPGFRSQINDHPISKFYKAITMKYAKVYMDYYFGEECSEKVNVSLVGDDALKYYNFFQNCFVTFPST